MLPSFKSNIILWIFCPHRLDWKFIRWCFFLAFSIFGRVKPITITENQFAVRKKMQCIFFIKTCSKLCINIVLLNNKWISKQNIQFWYEKLYLLGVWSETSFEEVDLRYVRAIVYGFIVTWSFFMFAYSFSALKGQPCKNKCLDLISSEATNINTFFPSLKCSWF